MLPPGCPGVVSKGACSAPFGSSPEWVSVFPWCPRGSGRSGFTAGSRAWGGVVRVAVLSVAGSRRVRRAGVPGVRFRLPGAGFRSSAGEGGCWGPLGVVVPVQRSRVTFSAQSGFVVVLRGDCGGLGDLGFLGDFSAAICLLFLSLLGPLFLVGAVHCLLSVSTPGLLPFPGWGCFCFLGGCLDAHGGDLFLLPGHLGPPLTLAALNLSPHPHIHHPHPSSPSPRPRPRPRPPPTRSLPACLPPPVLLTSPGPDPPWTLSSPSPTPSPSFPPDSPFSTLLDLPPAPYLTVAGGSGRSWMLHPEPASGCPLLLRPPTPSGRHLQTAICPCRPPRSPPLPPRHQPPAATHRRTSAPVTFPSLPGPSTSHPLGSYPCITMQGAAMEVWP